MDPTDLSDAQLDQLADQLAGRLPSGTHGDRVVLSRRAFAAAVGGTLGASGLVALGVDEASAQAAGQVGTSSSPVDARLFDLYVANALQSDLDAGGNTLTNVGSLSTESIENGPLYAGNYAGSDRDARLDNALADAGTDDVLWTEDGVYSADRTISTRLGQIRGVGARNGTAIDGEWTVDAEGVHISHIRTGNGNLVLTSPSISVTDIFMFSNTSVTIQGANTLLTSIQGAGTVTFESGASGGAIGVVDDRITINDNDGGNTTPPDN